MELRNHPQSHVAVLATQTQSGKFTKENEMTGASNESDFCKPEASNIHPRGDSPNGQQQKEKDMAIHQRFVLDEDRYVIDSLNPGGQKGCHHEGSPENQSCLRERVLMARLGKLVGDLIINLQPENEDAGGNKYKPFNIERHSIWWAICVAIRSSQLNALDSSVSIENKFDGKLKNRKNGMQEFTSLSLFRDDVERLLRDLYGDIDSETLDQVLCAVFTIVQEFTRYVRKDLWQEHHDAVNFDYAGGIGVPEGYAISGSEWRCGMIAIDNLRVRAREVRKNPAAFSKYTVEFMGGFEPDNSLDETDDELPF
jgi:hypothetical protein